MAANRIGKSYCGSSELAFHLTGIYPEWWEGKVFKQPIVAWAGGVSNETTRDIVQFELLGSPDDPEAFGSGTVPKNYIIKNGTQTGCSKCQECCVNTTCVRWELFFIL